MIISLYKMFRIGEGRMPRSLLITLAIFFLIEFLLFVVFSSYISRKNQAVHDCLQVNDTSVNVLTNLSALPSYENCSRGPFLGNEIFVHVCWYKNEVIVDIRRFNLDKPDILGIGLKKDNWYKLEDRTRNITKLVRDIEFNHTIFGYSDWL